MSPLPPLLRALKPLRDLSSEASARFASAVSHPLLALPPLGSALRRRLNEALFRRCFFAGLVLLGLHLVWRAWP